MSAPAPKPTPEELQALVNNLDPEKIWVGPKIEPKIPYAPNNLDNLRREVMRELYDDLDKMHNKGAPLAPKGSLPLEEIKAPGWTVYRLIITYTGPHMDEVKLIRYSAIHKTGMDYHVQVNAKNMSPRMHAELVEQLWRNMCAQEAINGGYV